VPSLGVRRHFALHSVYDRHSHRSVTPGDITAGVSPDPHLSPLHDSVWRLRQYMSGGAQFSCAFRSLPAAWRAECGRADRGGLATRWRSSCTCSGVPREGGVDLRVRSRYGCSRRIAVPASARPAAVRSGKFPQRRPFKSSSTRLSSFCSLKGAITKFTASPKFAPVSRIWSLTLALK
jgi:hypothetical protein